MVMGMRWAFIAAAGAAALGSLAGCGTSSGSATLSEGSGKVTIQSTWTAESQGFGTGQSFHGTVDGLSLTGTGSVDLAGRPYCAGWPGSTATGTLGGTAFHVQLKGCSQLTAGFEGSPPVFSQTYTGTWGALPVQVTGKLTLENPSLLTLTGTIGTQEVSATINLTPGTLPGDPGTSGDTPNTISGTMTVS
jgi:hypothetical protein